MTRTEKLEAVLVRWTMKNVELEVRIRRTTELLRGAEERACRLATRTDFAGELARRSFERMMERLRRELEELLALREEM